MWEAGRVGDAMAEEGLSDGPCALRGMLDDLGGVGAEASEAEFEQAMRAAYGERLRDGVRMECLIGDSRACRSECYIVPRRSEVERWQSWD